jgi:RNA-directed DNA polymerase
VDEAKPFNIPKRVVWKAFKRVKANQGSAGVDRQSIAGFEADLSNNLYKLWNRMCSGSYFPPPVRRVEIPKADGGMRPLGIPTVADRIAQEVARRYLEPRLEPVFHADSYGYRPGCSAIDAVRTARQRCWRYDWVLDIDVKGYFDSIDWELLLKAVRHHTDCPWVLLYIERWLKAPVQMEDGGIVPRTTGTPQGGVMSPLLANLFLPIAAVSNRSKKNLYSITSSARTSTVSGIARPSALAVLRLITISYFTGACTGRSAGFSPLRIRST